MPEKARIAVIGTGWWATTAHLPSLQEDPDAEIVAVSDLRPEVLAKAAEHYGVAATYADHQEMLQQEQPDGGVVAVYHSAHYDVARDWLEAGAHILLEKPMVLTAPHARSLVELANDRGRELIMGYPFQYTPHARRAREVLAAGELGEIRYVNSLFATMVLHFMRGDDSEYEKVFNYPVVGPGNVYNDPARSGQGQGHLQVTHSAGLVFYLTGLVPARVTGLMANIDLPCDIVDAISVRMESGALASIGSTGIMRPGDDDHHETRVFCDAGWLDIDPLGGTLSIRHADQSFEQPDKLEGDAIYPMRAPAQNLVQVALGTGANESPAEVGWRTVELLDAAYRSAAQDGAPVDVESLY